MKTPTEIVNDTRAFLTSTAATVGGVAVTIAGLAAAAVVLIPDSYSDIKATVIAIGALAATIGGIARQAIAWLDPNNSSFGRVKVIEGPPVEPEPDVIIDPDLSDHVPESVMNPKVDESLLPDESMPQDGE